MTTGSLEGPHIGLGKLLSDSRFLVPPHQREYSWGEDHIIQLFEDIKEARERGLEAYFLGLMVFIPGRQGELQVLDGQQRLATAVIILASVRAWLRRYSEFDADSTQIQHSYIGHRELGRKEINPRLIMNETNHRVFEDFIVHDQTDEQIREALSKMKRFDPNRRLLEAALTCRSQVEAIASSVPDRGEGAEMLFGLVNYIRDGVRVVRLTVSSEADAYMVFETLNARGQDLSVLDLVKSHLFGKAESDAGHRLRDMKTRWTQMMSILSSVRGDDFLRAYWTSRHGRTRITNVFPDLKRRYTTPKSVVDLSIDMLTAAEQYAALDSPDDPVWNPYDPDARARLRVLKLLGASPVEPVLLAALARFEPREMERLLRFLEVLLVRYQLIGGGSTGQLETNCARLAFEIYTKKVTTATAAVESIKDIYPSDKTFQEAFAVKQERTNTKALYLLKGLEMEARRREDGQMWNVQEPGVTLTVEHILPRNPSTEWKQETQADQGLVEECAFRLGNLCLLNKVNKDLGRKGFTDKKPALAATPLKITQEVSQAETWGRKEIEDRQLRMAKLAVSAWRFN